MPTFYRVVKSNPPTERDFLSNQALGRRLRNDTPEKRRRWDGVSVASTTDYAAFLASQFPQMGSFIAIVEIEDGGPIRFEQTGHDAEHYTLWGSATELLERVRSVMPL